MCPVFEISEEVAYHAEILITTKDRVKDLITKMTDKDQNQDEAKMNDGRGGELPGCQQPPLIISLSKSARK